MTMTPEELARRKESIARSEAYRSRLDSEAAALAEYIAGRGLTVNEAESVFERASYLIRRSPVIAHPEAAQESNPR